MAIKSDLRSKPRIFFIKRMEKKEKRNVDNFKLRTELWFNVSLANSYPQANKKYKIMKISKMMKTTHILTRYLFCLCSK